MGPHNPALTGIDNQADVTATDPGGSPVNGTDNATPVFPPPAPAIDVVKTISSNPTLNANGTYDVTFDFVIENTGDQILDNIQLTDNLSAFAPINSLNSSLTGNLLFNQNYDGITDINLLNGTGGLSLNETVTISLVVNMGPHNPALTGIDNQTGVTATDPGGSPVSFRYCQPCFSNTCASYRYCKNSNLQSYFKCGWHL